MQCETGGFDMKHRQTTNLNDLGSIFPFTDYSHCVFI